MGLKRSVRTLGLDPRGILNSSRGVATYRANRAEFLRQAQGQSRWQIGESYREVDLHSAVGQSTFDVENGCITYMLVKRG